MKTVPIGDKIVLDGYEFTVSEVIPHRDPAIGCSITLRGEGGSIEMGYYEYLKYKTKEEILKAVAEEAYENYEKIVGIYKADKSMNHKIELSYEFCIVYGRTIKQIQVVFPNGYQEDIWTFKFKAEEL